MRTFPTTGANFGERVLGRVTAVDPSSATLVALDGGVRLVLARGSESRLREAVVPPAAVACLRVDDIVEVIPGTRMSLLLSPSSNDCSLMLTEACNLRCLTCPQPPSSPSRDWLALARELVQAVRTPPVAFGITGGEPTLAFSDFLGMLDLLHRRFPDTPVEVLTNATAFEDAARVREVAGVGHAGVSFHVTIFSDAESLHNELTGCGSFYPTVRGLQNLVGHGFPVEVRTVVTARTYRRLPQLAEFVCAYLPEAFRFAVMALEPMGEARRNIASLYVSPAEAADHLLAAVQTCTRAGMTCALYNYQLCSLPHPLWRHCARSISDWKARFPPACAGCDVNDLCGGFFESQVEMGYSGNIVPVKVWD